VAGDIPCLSDWSFTGDMRWDIPPVLLIHELDRGFVNHHAEPEDELELGDELKRVDHIERGL
jgi:hypothetical protein